MKKGILTAFLGFLAFMAVCTVVAKGIYKSGLARVTVCHPEKMGITYKISAAGTALPGQEYGVYAEEGLRVSAIMVQEGEKVMKGDALFSVDPDDLEEKIRDAEAERDYLNAQLQDIAGVQKEKSRERERAAARLLADYDSLVREQDLRIGECSLSADTARLQHQNAEKALKAYRAGSVSGADTEADEIQRLKLDAELLKVEYERALNALEHAKLQKEEAIRSWNRSLEDARGESYSDLAQTVRLQGELARVELKLEKLKSLRERRGVVRAEADGMILGIFLKIGERTADGACMLYAPMDGSGDIQVCLGEQDASRLSIGDSVALQYKTASGEKKKESGIISYIEQGNGEKILRIKPETAGLLPGQTVQADASVKSGSYESVIPVGALHREELTGCFVYVVEQQDGILGTEDRVRKVPVTVLEQNEMYAAVESSALSADSAVVAGGNRELLPDDAVRVLPE